MSGSNQELGRRSEGLAASFLMTRGLRVIARNARLGGVEVDLLLEDGDELVVCEVKASARAGAVRPEERIGPAKRRRLLRAASVLAAAYPHRCVRIDAVAVEWDRGKLLWLRGVVSG